MESADIANQTGGSGTLYGERGLHISRNPGHWRLSDAAGVSPSVARTFWPQEKGATLGGKDYVSSAIESASG